MHSLRRHPAGVLLIGLSEAGAGTEKRRPFARVSARPYRAGVEKIRRRTRGRDELVRHRRLIAHDGNHHAAPRHKDHVQWIPPVAHARRGPIKVENHPACRLKRLSMSSRCWPLASPPTPSQTHAIRSASRSLRDPLEPPAPVTRSPVIAADASPAPAHAGPAQRPRPELNRAQGNAKRREPELSVVRRKPKGRASDRVFPRKARTALS